MLQDIIRKRKSGSKSVLPAFRYHPSPRPQLQAFCQSMPSAAKTELLLSKSDQGLEQTSTGVVDAPSVNSFKNRSDTHWKNTGYGH